MSSINKVAWDNMPETAMPAVAGSILRRFVGGQQMTVARIAFSEGAAVAEHRHVNEQFSLVLEGEMEFVVEGEKTIVRAGEIIHLPASSFHGARAISASVILDVFSPPRADWGPPGAA